MSMKPKKKVILNISFIIVEAVCKNGNNCGGMHMTV